MRVPALDTGWFEYVDAQPLAPILHRGFRSVLSIAAPEIVPGAGERLFFERRQDKVWKHAKNMGAAFLREHRQSPIGADIVGANPHRVADSQPAIAHQVNEAAEPQRVGLCNKTEHPPPAGPLPPEFSASPPALSRADLSEPASL